MLHSILTSGPFFWPILLLFAVVVICAIRLSRQRALAMVVLLFLAGPARAGGITDGGWSADIGADRYVFVFHETAEGSLSGMSHSLTEGRQYLQEPFRVERYEHSEVEFVMSNSGVRYVGRVEPDAGRITGGLHFQDGNGMDLDLVQLDPATQPGIPALMPDQLPWKYSPPRDLHDGWNTGDASEHGIGPDLLESIIHNVVDGQAGLLHSLVVVHDGTLVVEEYFHGYDASTLHPLASVTKSVSALLIGIALGQGEIHGLDSPLVGYFPGVTVADDRWNPVTLEHLLTMSIGLDWNDTEAETVHGTGPEFFARIFDRGFIGEPGTQFRYVNANVNLISGVIENATGESPEKFAEEHLFEPLGIKDWNWRYAAEGDHRLMDGSLQLRPRDMARLGQMMLDGGRWNGEQVVPAEFVSAALSSQIGTGGHGPTRDGYGYLWWTLGIDGPNGPVDLAFANGYGSQFIFVIPSLDLVFVTTGGNRYNGMHTAPRQAIGLPLLSSLGAL